jgi:phospholipid/cholesterol/gamma-HCH transport system permease protein
MIKAAGFIGKKSIEFVIYFTDLIAFSCELLFLVFKRDNRGRKIIWHNIIEQIYFTAVQSLPVIISIALIVGSMIIIQISMISYKYDLSKVIVFLIIREVGPMTTALIVIMRSATAVTIEMAYMNILNEIESVEMAGIDPIRLFCMPRLVGITSAVLSLFIVFDITAILGGYIITWSITDLPLDNYFDQIGKAISLDDVFIGLIKAISFGIIISSISLFHGLKTKKRITHIPVVVSKTSLNCFSYCLLMNLFISGLFFF